MCSHGNHRDGLGTYIARGDRDIVDRVDRDRCCDDILGPRFVLAAPGLCLGNPGPRMLPEARHPASTAVLSARLGMELMRPTARTNIWGRLGMELMRPAARVSMIVSSALPKRPTF